MVLAVPCDFQEDMVTLSTSSALFLAMYVDRWQMRCSKGVLGSYILVRDNEAERREVAVVKDNWVNFHLLLNNLKISIIWFIICSEFWYLFMFVYTQVSCYHLREISSYQLVFSYVLSIWKDLVIEKILLYLISIQFLVKFSDFSVTESGWGSRDLMELNLK